MSLHGQVEPLRHSEYGLVRAHRSERFMTYTFDPLDDPSHRALSLPRFSPS